LEIHRSARQLLSEVEHRLSANRPSFHASPLQDVIDLLCRGRHYSWVGIYLATGNNAAQHLLGEGREPHPGQMARPETKSKILVSMRLANRELGVLDVESDRENAFGSEDRMLLENVADVLARFLAASGKYLTRRARTRSVGKAVSAVGNR
jgi:putative methionine-R-sulfoxide reductase with GAF domain